MPFALFSSGQYLTWLPFWRVNANKTLFNPDPQAQSESFRDIPLTQSVPICDVLGSEPSLAQKQSSSEYVSYHGEGISAAGFVLIT